MRSFIVLSLASTLMCSCSTLDQSMRLGASAGSLAGAVATYSAHSSTGNSPSFQQVGMGASVGLAIGLITSYLIHGEVQKDREEAIRQPEIYFGDLPPSPFVIPNIQRKGKR